MCERRVGADLGILRLPGTPALEKVHGEGNIGYRLGSGTFVADSLPETFLSPGRPKTQLLVERPPRLSDRVRNLPDKRVGKQFDFGIAGPPGGSFVPAFPALDEFPIEIWERLPSQVPPKKGPHLLSYPSHRADPHP